MIFEKIESVYEGMSDVQKRIAGHVLERRQRIGFSSIHSLGREIGVSNASIVRFARSLGYSGYDEFRKSVQAEIEEKLAPYDKIALSDLDALPAEKQLSKLFQNEVDNLKTTLENMDVRAVHAMVDGIVAAGRLFVSGFGVSRHVMMIFEYGLTSTLSKEVQVLTGSVSDFTPRLHTVEKGDALCIMTFPPYSKEVIFVAESVKRRGGRVFLLTDSARCPIYALADAVVRCENNSLLLTNSYVGPIAVLQILINIVLLNDKRSAVSRMAGIINAERAGYARISEEGT